MKLKFINVIFCDDIRREITNKDILLGVYAGQINIHVKPVQFTFCLWIEAESDVSGVDRVELQVEYPKGTPISNIDFPVTIDGTKSLAMAVSALTLKFEDDGVIAVKVRTGSTPWETVREMKISYAGPNA